MAANPHKRKMMQVLTEKAKELFALLASGKTEAEVAESVGVFPAQMRKFYASHEDFRDPYRSALQAAQDLRDAQAKKVAKVKGAPTQTQKIAMFEQEILNHLREGCLIRGVAKMYEVDYAAIVKYFRADERRAEYEAALKEGGHALAEKSVEVTFYRVLDLTDAKVMDTRSNRLAWLAAKRNEQYDNRQSIKHSGTLVSSVSIDISTGD
jgi:hypothetical protein